MICCHHGSLLNSSSARSSSSLLASSLAAAVLGDSPCSFFLRMALVVVAITMAAPVMVAGAAGEAPEGCVRPRRAQQGAAETTASTLVPNAERQAGTVLAFPTR